jgi:tetratricopeptide (TPR) repeat protein
MMATRKYINGRSWLLLFLAINFWPLTLLADSIEEQLYRQGNRHYSRAQYAQAAEKWQSILRSGYVSGELHYNLGNAYYKMNDIGRAILHYEKALPYMPDDEDLINNLDMARLKTKDKIAKVPEFFLAKVINGFLDLFTIPIAGYLALGSFYLLGIVAIVNLKQWIAPSLGNILVIAMIAVSVFLGSVFATKSYRHATTQTAIVLADELNAKSEPQNSASTLFIIHEGLKVLITRQDGRWVEIKLPDGNKGWVELTSLGKI